MNKVNKLLLIFLFAVQIACGQDKGIIKIDTIGFKEVANNLTKEDTKRPLAIYLPPGYYNSSKARLKQLKNLKTG